VSADITRDTLLVAARKHLGPGMTRQQAVVVAYAELVGEALDPWAFDDAAIILRAEALLLEGLTVVDAVATAREELATWS
jgi:hypothetical protein